MLTTLLNQRSSGIPFPDANTASLGFTVGGSDARQNGDTASATVSLAGSGSETKTGNDALGVVLRLDASGSDAHGQSEAIGTNYLALTPTGLTSTIATDGGLTTLLAIAGISDTAERTDATQALLRYTITPVEGLAAQDAGLTYVTLVTQATEGMVGSDAGTASLKYAAQGIESSGLAYADTAVARVVYAIGGSDDFAGNDSAVGRVAFAVSGETTSTRSDSATTYVYGRPYAQDIYVAGDATTAYATLESGSADVGSYMDDGMVPVQLYPQGSDVRYVFDLDDAVLSLLPSSIDSLQRTSTDSGAGKVTFTPSYVGGFGCSDFATVAIVVRGPTLSYDLSAILYKKWCAVMTQKYRVARMFGKWSARSNSVKYAGRMFQKVGAQWSE